ncbi:hypothetical protein LJC18_02305 [Lachnospiraceae bacterium OttesenSCG-928-E19]|nr:hypothetical protein [Lachnospiraceae bacterium OttesenSCG-928-E19]
MAQKGSEMTVNIGAQQANQLFESVLTASKPAQAAFLLIPHERIVEDTQFGRPGFQSYLNALAKGTWQWLLNRSDLHRGKSEFMRFAEFLPKMHRRETIEILCDFGSFDREPLFAESCRHDGVPHKILCQNPKLTRADKWELIHQYNHKKIMVFPNLLSVNTIENILGGMSSTQKNKLFNEHINVGEKSFFYLNNKGTIQNDELRKMKPYIAYKFLRSQISNNDPDTWGNASVLSALEYNNTMHYVFNMPWTDRQLFELCRAPAGYGRWTFFILDNKLKHTVLTKMTPEFRTKLVFSAMGKNCIENDLNTQYILMLRDSQLFKEKQLDYILNAYNRNFKKQQQIESERYAREQENKRLLATTFTGVFNQQKYDELIHSVINSRGKRK